MVSFRISAASAACVDLQDTLKYKICRILSILSILVVGKCSEWESLGRFMNMMSQSEMISYLADTIKCQGN